MNRHVAGSLESKRDGEEVLKVLFALAVLLLLLAIVGGIAVHPLLFLLVVVALVCFVGGRRGSLT
jgi:hypothetical protein